MTGHVAPVLQQARPYAMELPDLSVLKEGRRPPPPLPLEIFEPAWSQWITIAADKSGSPIDYIAGSLLAGTAALIGNSRAVSPWDGWTEPAILWVGLVGDPSSNKSPAMDPVLQILRSIEADSLPDFQEQQRSWEGAKTLAKITRASWEEEVKQATRQNTPPPQMPDAAQEPDEPIRPRLIASDATIESLGIIAAGNPKGLLYWRDELAGFLGSFDRYGGNGGDRAFWIEGFGARPFTIDRVKNGRKPVRIDRLSISVLGGIQPDRLSTTLLVGDDDGFPARFLWLWPERIKPSRPTTSKLPDWGSDALRRLASLQLARVGLDQLAPIVLGLAPDAADAFQEWRLEHDKGDTTGMLASFYGKAPGCLLRVSLILELLWWSAGPNIPEPTQISLAAISGAAVLMEQYFKPSADRVYGDAALPEADRLTARLARWIVKERPATINARDVRRVVRLPGLTEADKVKIAIDGCMEAKLLFAIAETDRGAGRPRADYIVNPQAWRGTL